MFTAFGLPSFPDIWNDDFGVDLAIAILPFAIVAVACVWIKNEMDDARPRSSTRWRKRAYVAKRNRA